MQLIAETFRGIPLVFNWVESGKTPLFSLEEIHQLGFKLVLFSVSLLFAATHNVLALLDLLKQGQTPTAFAEHLVTSPSSPTTSGYRKFRRWNVVTAWFRRALPADRGDGGSATLAAKGTKQAYACGDAAGKIAVKQDPCPT